jgi:chloramphenicol-sensitive protein RarD
LLPAVAATGSLRSLPGTLASPRQFAWHACSGLLLACNWFLYIHATLTNRIIEGSLGYFLTPLLNVALGWLFLGEKSTGRQVVAIGFAVLGVALQAVAVGGMPWIALGLACSFGLYGLARKQSPLGALDGLAVETLLMSPFALAGLWLAPGVAFLSLPLASRWLLAGSGVVTSIPLLWFAFGARRLRLATLGILQFLVPSLQFTLGCWLYHEPFNLLRLASFVLIWIGVALFLVPGRKLGTAGAPP